MVAAFGRKEVTNIGSSLFGVRRQEARGVKLKVKGLRLKIFSFGVLLFLGLPVFFVIFDQKANSFDKIVLVFSYKVVNVFPHDPRAFTQGLVFRQGFLYEGTGLEGQSTLRKVELETGKVVQQHRLPESLFGEGLTLWADQLIQLTWKNRLALVYDRPSFRLLKKFSYSTEGWGITQDGNQLIMSNGTNTLTFLDPRNFKENKRIQVHDRGLSLPFLNELEYIKGEIFANVFPTDWIARISPETGRVTGWIDLTGLLAKEDRLQGVDVLNGIAYDSRHDRIFVTGKYWPKVFEIQLVPTMRVRPLLLD